MKDKIEWTILGITGGLLLICIVWGAWATMICMIGCGMAVAGIVNMAIEGQIPVRETGAENDEGEQMSWMEKRKDEETTDRRGKKGVMDEEGKRYCVDDDVVDEMVNRALERLLEQTTDSYVNGWYETSISGDKALINEIRWGMMRDDNILDRHQIAYVCRGIAERMKKVDMKGMMEEDLLPTVAVHCAHIIEMEKKIDEKVEREEIDREPEQTSPRATTEGRILESMIGLHRGMKDRRQEADYIREVRKYSIV